jgi:cell wall assembly regulator SMI1
MSGGIGRNPPLSSVGTYRDSHHDLSGYHEDGARSTTALHAPGGLQTPRSASTVGSPTSPYSPGMRSSQIQQQSDPAGGIAMQDFGPEGVPPPPPVAHSWSRIDRWAEKNYPELFDQLCEPATMNDLNELEHELDCSLPMELRESIMFHDGQERGGRPTGIILGAMLLDCEEILDEWNNWRTVNVHYLSQQPLGGLGAPGGSKAANRMSIQGTQIQKRQDSHPDGHVQKVYSHPGWIPMARDWGGNYIAVDLAPGPLGKWGQVILFGRDYDCKFVVARSWAAFLATVADDLESPHWYVDEDGGELRLRDPKSPRAEPTYLQILRVRCERKYGRKFRPRPGPPPGHRNSQNPTSPGGSNQFLTPPAGGRGGRSKDTTKLHHPTPKPLPRVLEEVPISNVGPTAEEKGKAPVHVNGSARSSVDSKKGKEKDLLGDSSSEGSASNGPTPATTPPPAGKRKSKEEEKRDVIAQMNDVRLTDDEDEDDEDDKKKEEAKDKKAATVETGP